MQTFGDVFFPVKFISNPQTRCKQDNGLCKSLQTDQHGTQLGYLSFFLWEHIWHDTLERCINNVTSRYRDSLSDIFVDTVLHQWAMENVKSNFYQRNKTIVGANGAMQKNRSHPEHVTWLRSWPKHQRLNLQQKHLKQSSRFERHSVFSLWEYATTWLVVGILINHLQNCCTLTDRQRGKQAGMLARCLDHLMAG